MRASVLSSTLTAGWFYRDRTLYPVAALSAALVGATLAIEPAFAVLPVAVLICGVLLIDARARVLFVLFGGLAIFQQGDDLSPLKVAFLLGFGVACAGAATNVLRIRDTATLEAARPLIAASIAMGGLLVISAGVAYAHATPVGSLWLRDVAPYFLFIAVPLFGLDAREAFSYRALVRILVAAGILGALAFAVTWLQRRGIADFGTERIGLATHYVPAGLFAYAMSLALCARKLRWLAVAGLVLALLLATGTRSNLALLMAPLAIAVGSRHAIARRSVRVLVFLPLTAVATTLIAFAVLQASSANLDHVERRIEAFRTSGTGEDNSFVERQRQTEVALDAFSDHPVFGAGPGTLFEWQTVDFRQVTSYLLDTPATFPAKFGILGLVTLLFVLSRYLAFIRIIGRHSGNGEMYFTLVGYAAIVAASTLFYSPLEDKGFAFTLILLVGLALHPRQRLSDPARPANPER